MYRDTMVGATAGIMTVKDTDQKYVYLERRADSWRRQLFVKGRGIPAGHVVRSMLTNQHTPRQEAEERDLPLEAVYECLRYYDEHEEDILADIQQERADALASGVKLD